ncbi:MAG: hypothetical protein K2Y27_05190 [Xanthobacteraceae bacterium]|nr:hypothetical protein [Xanthobacteraceae bacterium]
MMEKLPARARLAIQHVKLEGLSVAEAAARRVTRYLWIAVSSALAVALTSGVLALGG